MSDFAELKKRVDEFLKEVKVFSSELKGGDEAEKQQQRLIDLRNKKKEYVKEIKDFEPAKKIMLLDSKKSSLLKSLQDEIGKAEKAMTKQKIDVPKDEEEGDEERDNSADKKNKKDSAKDGDKGVSRKEGGRTHSSKEDKKGKNKVQVIDDDRKSTSSAKVKQEEEQSDNDFEDTEEEDDQDKNRSRAGNSAAAAEEEEEAEEVDEDEEDAEEDKVSAKSKSKDKEEKKTDDKKGKKTKDKTEQAEAAKKDAEGKKGEKISRKDSQKSVADGKESKKGVAKEKGKGKKKEDKKGKEKDGGNGEEDVEKEKEEKGKGKKKEDKKGKEKDGGNSEVGVEKEKEEKGKGKKKEKKGKEKDGGNGEEGVEKEKEEKGKGKKKEKKGEEKDGGNGEEDVENENDEKGKGKKKEKKGKEKDVGNGEEDVEKEKEEKGKGKKKEDKKGKEKDSVKGEEGEQNEKDLKKSGTKKDEKGKKDDEQNGGSKKENSAQKEDKKLKKAKSGEEKGESADEPREEDTKEKRRSKEVKESKDEKKDKSGKEMNSKEKETGKNEDKEDIKSKKEGKEDKKASKTDEKKEQSAKEMILTHQEPKQRAAVAGTARTASQEGDFISDSEGDFSEETEDDEEADAAPVVTKHAAGVQLAAAPATKTPMPAPRQKPAEGPAPATATAKVAAPAAATSKVAAPPSQAREPAAELEDDDYEDEDDEEDSEYDYANMRTLGPNDPNKYEVLRAYSEDDSDVMSIRLGELLTVLKVGPDGWWLARNAQGREGLVPSTLLRLAPDDESEGSELEEVTQADTTIATSGPEDLSRTGPTEGDDESDDDMTTGDGDDEKMVAENLQAPPGLPAGFRVSSVAKWFYGGTKAFPGRQFTLQSLLQPKLTASCMSLQDGWGCTQQIRPVPSRIEKLVHLQKCQLMPAGLPVKVLDRFIRLCLFDVSGPVSNVHTVRASVAKDERVWSFGTRVTDTGSGLDYGEVYLRYNYAQNRVQLLLEATIVCQNEATGAEPMELSIGHAMVPLFDENGSPMPAKAFDLQFEGGTPFERQQDVDPSLGQSGGSQKSGGASARSQPRIQLKLSVPNKETKDFMDTCPTTIIGNLANLQLHSLYRQVLASELSYSSRLLEQRSSPIYAPHLVQFPTIADQPDLMDSVRRRWNEFAKRDRAFKKPAVTEVMKQEFIRIVKSTYFLNQLKDFQPYVFGNKAQEQLRANLIQDFLRKIATDQTAVNFSLSADLLFEPFSMDEVALPMIGQFSVPVLPVAE